MVEENNKINYSDLIELGFQRADYPDSVHFHQYGYPYFYLVYGDGNKDKISMEWSPTSREVNLYINTHTYRKGISLDEVKNIIDFLEDE